MQESLRAYRVQVCGFLREIYSVQKNLGRAPCGPPFQEQVHGKTGDWKAS